MIQYDRTNFYDENLRKRLARTEGLIPNTGLSV